MSAVPHDEPVVAAWSTAGLAAGVRLALSGVAPMAVFGAAFGVAAAQNGLTPAEAILMSTFVFAGASQFVIVEIWANAATAAGVIVIGMTAAVVNMRLLLMSASLRPWLGASPAWQAYPALSLLTDPGWLLVARYRANGGCDAAALLGSGVVLWLTWIAATASGYPLGVLIADPARFGLDLVMPCFFIVMLVPLWRGPRRAIPWLVAGAVALLAAKLMPSWWFIMAGATAGSLTAGLVDEQS
jgi:predicted branched-subunit amino acid permease